MAMIPLSQIARETAEAYNHDLVERFADLSTGTLPTLAERIDAATQQAVRDFATALKAELSHSRDCRAWNCHSDGEADFRDSPYRCQCFEKTIDTLLRAQGIEP